MAERLHVVIPSAKWDNLGVLLYYYTKKMEKNPFEVRIHLMIQGPDPDPKGFKKRQEGFDAVPDGWVLGVSDDAVHHPSLFRRLGEVIAKNPHAKAVVFSEERRGGCPYTGGKWPNGSMYGILIAHPGNMKVSHVDGSQVFWRRDFLGNERHDHVASPNEADGHFIVKMFNKEPSAFVFVEDALIRFNSLEW